MSDNNTKVNTLDDINMFAMRRCCHAMKRIWLVIPCMILTIALLQFYPTFTYNQEQPIQVLQDLEFNDFSFHTNNTIGFWQNVPVAKHKFFVYSAYYEYRPFYNRTLRVIGAKRISSKEKVFCILGYKSGYSKTVQATIQIIREHGNKPYAACFLFCPLEELPVPATVSIVIDPLSSPENIIQVIDPRSHRSRGNLSVCVKPMYNYNQTLHLIEFLEMYRLLGVEHFTLYDHTSSAQVQCVLREYSRQGLVLVLPWKLDLISKKEIRTEGIFASLNDCLYRNMNRYSNVAMIDFDEFIIPRDNLTLAELIDWMDNNIIKRLKNGAYEFKNAFFYKNYAVEPDVGKTDVLGSKLLTTRYKRRKKKVSGFLDRSKYVCKPEGVNMAGNHFIWEYHQGYGKILDNKQRALSQHYRSCETVKDVTIECEKLESIVDVTALRYKDRLLERVRQNYCVYHSSIVTINRMAVRFFKMAIEMRVVNQS